MLPVYPRGLFSPRYVPLLDAETRVDVPSNTTGLSEIREADEGEMVSCDVGVEVPRPNLLFDSSQKKFAACAD